MDRLGPAPVGSVRSRSGRLDSTGRDRSTAPGRSRSRRRTGGAGTVPQRDGRGWGRALPPPCPEPRPLITANYSPGAAAAPPCRGPGHPGAQCRPWPCRRALRPRRDRPGPGESAGPARGGVSAAVESPVTRCVPATRGDNRPLLIAVQSRSAGEGSGWRIMWNQGWGGRGGRDGGVPRLAWGWWWTMSGPRDILPRWTVSLRDPESLAKGDLVTAPHPVPPSQLVLATPDQGRMMSPAYGGSPNHGLSS